MQDRFSITEFRDLFAAVCSHSDTKRRCGFLLNIITNCMQPPDAANFVCDIMSFDFFEDLVGPVDDLLRELPHLKELIQQFMISKNIRGLESDEDEDGNLKY